MDNRETAKLQALWLALLPAGCWRPGEPRAAVPEKAPRSASLSLLLLSQTLVLTSFLLQNPGAPAAPWGGALVPAST